MNGCRIKQSFLHTKSYPERGEGMNSGMRTLCFLKRAMRDSNPRPLVPETNALSS